MMALNRYRLHNLADKGHRSARLALRLLQHPDRLLSTILLGNNVANLTAASVASVIALRLYGEAAIAASGFDQAKPTSSAGNDRPSMTTGSRSVR